MYTWITILLATAINDFNSGFNRIQKKASDQISQEDSKPSVPNFNAKFWKAERFRVTMSDLILITKSVSFT